ncbi:Uma2 family endonuclease [Catenulispora sp. NL8]|uniref:Uma2 family endonuclease n=1 Tax=Catenulispora pinistramenti TaxID=2705254 RepID=A0ABS5KUV9_9ACTN|nr:Uma2 family endonuclease [Catenulispora pinistramenti]MBS2549819.1 Uma2 family endonuclease [Catenulispora pinistramenti]
MTNVTQQERQLFYEFDAELHPNYRAQLIAQRIVISPPPPGNHEQAVAELSYRLACYSAVEIEISGYRGLETSFGNFIPDITVAEPGSFAGAPAWGTSVGTLMLVEVTSSAPQDDRGPKRRAYAAAGIPLYLLVERDRQEVVLFSQPDVEAQDYRADVRVPFGSDLELPAPFSFTLTDFTPRALRPREL